MPRLFVAVDLPERIRDDVGALCEALPGARWTPDGQLHVTLRFIGDVDGRAAQRIDGALRTVAFAPFTLRLKSTGFFPPRGRPRVLWCGIAQSGPLAALQKQTERALTAKAGIPPEGRKFSPHITIARLNDSPDDKLARFLSATALFETEEFMVSEICLYSSLLTRGGAAYTRESAYPQLK